MLFNNLKLFKSSDFGLTVSQNNVYAKNQLSSFLLLILLLYKPNPSNGKLSPTYLFKKDTCNFPPILFYSINKLLNSKSNQNLDIMQLFFIFKDYTTC